MPRRAPGSPATRTARFGLFIGGDWRKPKSGRFFDTIEPGDRRRCSPGSPRPARTMSTMRSPRPGRRKATWAALPGHERARYLYAIARQVQKNSRLFAVIEALDNGKPIRETRDIDVPLVARHFYHHAGWAELQGQEFPDRVPVGVCGQIIPWNFPLLMLAWKIAPGDRARQHRDPQAGRVHAAHRAPLRRDLPRWRACRQASSTSSPATAPPAS